MATIAEQSGAGRIASPLRRRWGWMLTLGIAQILGGVAALAVPAIASFVAVGMFSAILVISAVFHIAHAFKVRRWMGFGLHLLGGILYAVAGVIVLLDPLNGVATLMLVLGVLFIADGAIRTMLARAVKPGDGWGWFLAGGILSIVLGVMLLLMWPGGALWVVGTLLGINLLTSGVMTTTLAIQCHRHDDVGLGSANPAPV
jgi:uncharacterized membrane protein HdeD (DUF308 family)